MKTKDQNRADVKIRMTDINDIIEYGKAAGINPTEALDNVISAGLKARWDELEDLGNWTEGIDEWAHRKNALY